MNSSKISHFPIHTSELVELLCARVTKEILVVVGSCCAEFDGRIKSFLDFGDRILIVKPDESISLHGPVGVKPLNWQKEREGRISFFTKDESLIMSTYRPRTKERFEITFREVYSAFGFVAHDPAQLQILGDESHFAQYLSKHLDLIESGLELIALEYPTPHGSIDLFCQDAQGKQVIIELKKQAATLSDAQQLTRYRDSFSKDHEKSPRAILVAPSFSMRVRQYLQKRGFEAAIIAWQDIFPSLPPDPKHPSLDEFL
ncbi:MAG: endonuclease NucS domain-containing protein [Candidatus Hodarchaeales archaeon]|jgi:RecB family endonuclease NucS